jgi:PAS domain S-box-containing protein
LLLDMAPQALLTVDSAGHISFVNRASERLLGDDRHELQGQPFELLLNIEARPTWTEHLTHARRDLLAHRLGSAGDISLLHKDGGLLRVELDLQHVIGEDGPCTLLAVSDITERLQHEDELRRSRHNFEQLAYVTSHALQEPLRMVTSFLELLDRRYRGKLDERAGRYIHFAVDGAARMQRMLQDLVSYSRVGLRADPLSPVDIETVVRAALGPLSRNLTDSGAHVDIDPLPRVLGNEAQLRQLFGQLIDNGLKFCTSGPARVRVSAVPEGKWVRFSVQDNGLGMDMQHAERVFGMFERLHPLGTFAGNGMGLALARRIVEHHGGKIWLDSRPGSGTTVSLTLRAADEPS